MRVNEDHPSNVKHKMAQPGDAIVSRAQPKFMPSEIWDFCCKFLSIDMLINRLQFVDKSRAKVALSATQRIMEQCKKDPLDIFDYHRYDKHHHPDKYSVTLVWVAMHLSAFDPVFAFSAKCFSAMHMGNYAALHNGLGVPTRILEDETYISMAVKHCTEYEKSQYVIVRICRWLCERYYFQDSEAPVMRTFENENVKRLLQTALRDCFNPNEESLSLERFTTKQYVFQIMPASPGPVT